MIDIGDTTIQFRDPWLLSLLVLVAVAFALTALRERRPRAGVLFSSLSLVPDRRAPWRVRLRWILVPLRFVVLMLFVLALARPEVVRAAVESYSEGIDIVLVIDNSGSMDERTFGGTSKLEAVKKVVHDFLGGLTNDRVGMVAFAGDAVVLGPLTLDYSASQRLAENMDTGTLTGGTAIGIGLATGINVLRDSTAASKVAILLTDGENNTGQISPLDASRIASLVGVRVYTIGAMGIGAEGDVDEQVMRQMANNTGGRYFRASDESSLRQIYDEIEKLEKSKVGIREFTEYDEVHLPLLAAGAALFLLEVALVATLFRRVP